MLEITLRHGRYPVNLLHIFRRPFLENTSGGLLLYFNCRVGTEPDFMTENENDLHFLPEGYELDNKPSL